jgi:DNA-binding NarL/FixJ family response regulator
MPGLDGLTILRRAREGGLGTPVIVMTAHGDSNTAIEAMKSAAFDYVLKPLDIHQLLPQIERAIEHRRLAMELRSLRSQVAADGVTATMIGRSSAMQHVYKVIGQVAESDDRFDSRGVWHRKRTRCQRAIRWHNGGKMRDWFNASTRWHVVEIDLVGGLG